MRATVQQLCAGAHHRRAKIAAIYRFVTTDVRYEAWEFGVHGYKPYSTRVIHERRHGDCKDKALLLCALLGEIGVEASRC
jgi:transglutaminase-like putative cysteine protease